MKRKKFLALALAGVMTAATLTACAPLEDLYDWFFGGGSGSASRGNGVNLVEVSPGQKSQIVRWFGLNDGDVTTPDRSRKALEEVVGKLNAATMINSDTNALNTTGQKALNEVAKNQLPQNSGMCIDVEVVSDQRRCSPGDSEWQNALLGPVYRPWQWRHLRCGRKALGNGPTDLYERVVVLFHCEI